MRARPTSCAERSANAEPDVVICFGQADGRTAISVERFAHNLDEASHDRQRRRAGLRHGRSIRPARSRYASTLPVDEIVAALHAEGIPADASRDAGGFLCNHVFYVLMRLLEQERPGARGGFVHRAASCPSRHSTSRQRACRSSCCVAPDALSSRRAQQPRSAS